MIMSLSIITILIAIFLMIINGVSVLNILGIIIAGGAIVTFIILRGKLKKIIPSILACAGIVVIIIGEMTSAAPRLYFERAIDFSKTLQEGETEANSKFIPDLSKVNDSRNAGDYDKANEYLDELKFDFEDLDDYYWEKAKLAVESENTWYLESYLNEMKRHDKNYFDMRIEWAETKSELELLQVTQEAAGAFPNDDYYQFLAGGANIRSNNFEKASYYFKRAVTIDSQNVYSHYYYGYASLVLGNNKLAYDEMILAEKYIDQVVDKSDLEIIKSDIEYVKTLMEER